MHTKCIQYHSILATYSITVQVCPLHTHTHTHSYIHVDSCTCTYVCVYMCMHCTSARVCWLDVMSMLVLLPDLTHHAYDCFSTVVAESMNEYVASSWALFVSVCKLNHFMVRNHNPCDHLLSLSLR